MNRISFNRTIFGSILDFNNSLAVKGGGFTTGFSTSADLTVEVKISTSVGISVGVTVPGVSGLLGTKSVHKK